MAEQFFECKRAFDSRFTLKGTEPQYAPDRTFDTEHIFLDLKLDLSKKTLAGVCSTRLKAMVPSADKMVFDAVNMGIHSVRSHGKNLKFSYDKRKLTVSLVRPLNRGEILDLAIDYQVTEPKMGLYFIGPDRANPQKPVQVWTQGEDEYARYWFPCHDSPQDRTTTEVRVVVPEGFTAVSNGRLIKKISQGKTVSFHYRQDIPHATYLVTLAVGRFTEIRDAWGEVPVEYFVPEGREEDGRRAFGDTPKMMEFFSKKIGVPYPYPKYAQVAALDFIYGGMENTSATTQTSLTLHDERAHLDFSSNPLVAHELAHQWFGDLLTCRDWSHAWLNESFATYFEALYTEFDKGADEFALELRENAESYFEEDKDHYRRSIVTKKYKQPSDLFDRHLYEKGSLVLHMIRRLLGEDGFWKSIQTYVEDNRGRVVETRHLLDAIELSTGRNLSRFFDQWVFGAGHPEFKIRAWWDAAKKELVVRVDQTQSFSGDTGVFHLPVDFLFRTAKGDRRFTENVNKKSHLFRFALGHEPTLVLFDPDHWILKKVDFPKSENWWITQLTGDPSALGRADAAKALGDLGGRVAVKALSEALFKEPFWFVQGAIARALGHVGTPDATQTLLRAHEEISHPKARRMIIAAMGEGRESALHIRLWDTHAGEKSYFAYTQALRSLSRRGDPAVRRVLDEALEQTSWNDVIACGALEALSLLKPDDLITVLIRQTSDHHTPARRMAAVRCLTKVGVGDNAVQTRLVQLLKDPYLLVQMAAVKSLAKIGDERSVPALKKLTQGDRDGRLLRQAQEAVEKLSKNHDDEKSE